MGKMKDALAKIAKRVIGRDIEDTNSMSNILEEMDAGFDLPTNEEVDTKIGEAVTSVYRYKGSVATYDDLPTTGRKSGDVYNVADTGKNYAYNGSGWDDLGGSAVIVVENITQLTTAQCNRLKCGDRVVKLTGNQKHCYQVSYKEENVGMCLTYTDASLVETVSYDFVTDEWVYNSTDSTSLDKSKVVANPTMVGDEENLSSLEIDGVKFKAGGEEVHLYRHIVTFSCNNPSFEYRKTLYLTTSAQLTRQEYAAIYGYYQRELDGRQLWHSNKMVIMVDFNIGSDASGGKYREWNTTDGSTSSFVNLPCTMTDTVTQIF